MHKMKVIMMVLGVACMVSINSPAALGRTVCKSTKRNEFISSIPETDRSDFLNYELISAVRKYNRTDVKLIYGSDAEMQKLNCKYHKKFKDVAVPCGFSKALLQWVEGEAKYGKRLPKSVKKHSSHILCFPHGCVDVGDIGSVCCPF